MLSKYTGILCHKHRKAYRPHIHALRNSRLPRKLVRVGKQNKQTPMPICNHFSYDFQSDKTHQARIKKLKLIYPF